MMFEGALTHGQYIDEFEDVHPETLQRYYGAVSASSRSGTQRTDHDHTSTIEGQVSAAQEDNVRHDPITPAEH